MRFSSEEKTNQLTILIVAVSYGVPVGPPYPPIPPVGVAPPRAMCTPYRGTITLVDCDGKELVLVDDKTPFQYFYNLGLEVGM